MSLPLALKVVHILAAIVAVGANVSYVFWLRWAGRDRNRLVLVIEGVRQLDRLVANPAYGLVLLSGIGMVLGGWYSFETGWIAAALVLFFATAIFGITLFAPAIRRQLAEAQRDPLGPEYAAIARTSNLYGLIAIGLVVVIVVLMIVKPDLGF